MVWSFCPASPAVLHLSVLSYPGLFPPLLCSQHTQQFSPNWGICIKDITDAWKIPHWQVSSVILCCFVILSGIWSGPKHRVSWASKSHVTMLMCCSAWFNRCFFLPGFNVNYWKIVALLLPRMVCSKPFPLKCDACRSYPGVPSHPKHWITLTQLLGVLHYIINYCKASKVYLLQ